MAMLMGWVSFMLVLSLLSLLSGGHACRPPGGPGDLQVEPAGIGVHINELARKV